MTFLKHKYKKILSLFSQSPKKSRVTDVFLAQHLIFFAALFAVLPVTAENLPATVNADTIRQQLTKSISDRQNKPGLATLKRFYAQRNYQPVWATESGQPLPELDTALALIEQADEEGLASSDYNIEHLRLLRNEHSGQISLPLELYATQSLLALARDLHRGRLLAAAADPDWHIPQPLFDPADFLQQVVTRRNLEQAFASLPPDMPQYHSLKQLLAKLRELIAAGATWTRIPEGIPSIHPNTLHPSVPLIRQRILEAYALFEKPEYAIAVSHSEFYDEQLEKAVRAFQHQYGLNADGIIGRNTRRAMNTTQSEHIQKLRINLERLRWLPRKFSDCCYILVNIAGFHLVAIKNNTRVLDMRIVVGRDYRSTPSFNSQISHIVINPYWNVPDSIARKDLLPKQKQDPNYFTSQGIRIFSDYRHELELDPDMIDWHAIDRSFPYALRQEPGKKNALGTIKFMFPNPFSIYLHDTPSKSLFQRDIRTYSSGCIRLEKPLQLAEFVLGRSFEKTSVIEKINSGKTYTVHLPERLPIYLVYLTAWSDGQGEVRFSSDVYGRDKRALAYAHWLEPAPHLSPSF